MPNIAAARSVAASRGARRSSITAPRCHIWLPAVSLNHRAGPYRACMRFESRAASHACRVNPDRVLGKGALFMIFRLAVVPEQIVRQYFLHVKKLTFKCTLGSQYALPTQSCVNLCCSWSIESTAFTVFEYHCKITNYETLDLYITASIALLYVEPCFRE
jgi:hypothetical protein